MNHEQKTAEESLALEVLRAAIEHEFCESLFWSHPVQPNIICNDLFWWGCADCEEIGPGEAAEIVKAISECKVGEKHYLASLYGPELWVARKRKMRPQGAAYPQNQDVWPLFDECGPAREQDTPRPKQAVQT